MFPLRCFEIKCNHLRFRGFRLHPIIHHPGKSGSRTAGVIARSASSGNSDEPKSLRYIASVSDAAPDLSNSDGSPPESPKLGRTANDDRPPPINVSAILLLAAFVGASIWLLYEISRSLRPTRGDVGTADTAGSGQTAAAIPDRRTVSDDILALKRLLREVFEKLLKLDERVTELEPKDDDDAGVTIPALEGPKITYVIKRADEGAAELAQVHIHGRLQFGMFKPFVEGAAAVGSSELLQQVTGPVLRLVAHSLLAEEDACLIAAATVTQRGMATLDKVLLKAKLHGKTRLLCSFLGGSIENIAPRINPFTGYGVTDTLRKGHGLEFVHNGGTGPAVAVSSGPLALSAGYFVEGGPVLTTNSVIQATLRAEGLASCHVLLAQQNPWFRSEAPREAVEGRQQDDSAAASTPGPIPSVPALFLPRPGRVRTRAHEEGRKFDGGIAGTVHIGEGLVMSGWSRWDVCEQALNTWGVGLCTQPDEGGHMVGLAVSKNMRQAGGAWMGEVSARIQTADGFTTSPSAVFYQLGSQKVFAVGTQAEWRF